MHRANYQIYFWLNYKRDCAASVFDVVYTLGESRDEKD